MWLVLEGGVRISVRTIEESVEQRSCVAMWCHRCGYQGRVVDVDQSANFLAAVRDLVWFVSLSSATKLFFYPSFKRR